jgi:hypothetical protein
MMHQDDVLIKEYEIGDETGILSLFKEVFGFNRDENHWNWQFINHCQGRGIITLANMSGQTVAQYSMMRNNLNFMGREIIAAQSCDTMVRSDFRKKGLFSHLAERNYSFAAKNGVQAVFGFPNRNSYPGIVRNLKWYRIFFLNHYLLRFGYEKIWGGRFDQIHKHVRGMLNRLKYISLRFRQKNIDISVSYELPDDLDDCLAEIRDYEVLSVWKDLNYLRWRYQNHPNFIYKFHILRYINRINGIIITRNLGNRIAICDVLHRNKSVLQASILLCHVLLNYKDSGAQAIDFYGYDNGFFDTIFRMCGFKKSSISDFVFGGRVFVTNKFEKMFLMPHNWTITHGDTDVI